MREREGWLVLPEREQRVAEPGCGHEKNRPIHQLSREGEPEWLPEKDDDEQSCRKRTFCSGSIEVFDEPCERSDEIDQSVIEADARDKSKAEDGEAGDRNGSARL